MSKEKSLIEKLQSELRHYKLSLVDNKYIELCKQEARHLKRSSSLTHSQALDHVAQKHGFRDWNNIKAESKRLSALSPIGLCLRDPTLAPCASLNPCSGCVSNGAKSL